MKLDPLQFETVEEAEYVLKAYPIAARLRRLRLKGVDLTEYTHQQLATFIGCTREKLTRAMVMMGMRRRLVRVYPSKVVNE